MTEEEWLTTDEPWQPLLHVRQFASVRKLRLVAAAYVRWLQSLPAYADARPCADLIEEVADDAMSRQEILDYRMWGLPGSSWVLSKALGSDGRVGQEVSRLVYLAQDHLGRCPPDPESAHREVLERLHCIFGNPFRPPPTLDARLVDREASCLATAAYEHRDLPSGRLRPERLAALAAALEAAGCQDAELLAHLRSEGPHWRGCWGLDAVLGRS